ncbi:MAG TPA: HesA/MoeB/ThiF family protein [Phycisphaerae bacterium]|nr:HesA/MoeB/ThiF family protein [Phycisphaerae bacterium]
MDPSRRQSAARYVRQMTYGRFGIDGQRRLAGGRALIVGVGGLGCTAADLLARAGVGAIRLVDDDTVSVENLHRQVLFDEQDAAAALAKVDAAAGRLKRINADVRVEAVRDRLTPANAAELAEGVDVILDGTDSFPTRFVLNDLSIQRRIPWVFAGVVGAEAQIMTVVPGRTRCLRCVFDSPPPPCVDPTCRTAGVLGPAVAAVAAMQAMEAIKILSGHPERVRGDLVKFDLWTGELQRIDVSAACADVPCPCCQGGRFDFLGG